MPGVIRKIEVEEGHHFASDIERRKLFSDQRTGLLLPNTQVWEAGRLSIKVNSLGCVGPELTPDKPVNAYFGDSVTMGFHDDSWPSRVDIPGTQTLNAAIEDARMSTMVERYDTLKQEVEFAAVIACLGWDDLIYNEVGESYWASQLERFLGDHVTAYGTIATCMTPDFRTRGFQPLLNRDIEPSDSEYFNFWGDFEASQERVNRLLDLIERYNMFLEWFCVKNGALILDLYNFLLPARYEDAPMDFFDVCHSRRHAWPKVARYVTETLREPVTAAIEAKAGRSDSSLRSNLRPERDDKPTQAEDLRRNVMRLEQPPHHPNFSGLTRWRGQKQMGQEIDFLGLKTRTRFVEGMVEAFGFKDGAEAQPSDAIEPSLPPFDEEYFEWIDLLESVKAAKGQFVMFELGAGYGRWLVRAVAVLHRLNPLPFKLVAVESEPTHFRWLHDHLRDNGIDPRPHELIEAAVNGTGETVRFHVGNPSGWYGQAIAVGESVTPKEKLELRARVAANKLSARLEWFGPRDEVGKVGVRGVTLNAILSRYDTVDLIDLDVQGAEFEVLSASIDRLNRQVKRVHIGTHSSEIEDGLRALFSSHGWECVNDYRCLSPNQTPYGEIEFGDGVQTWVNPR